MAKIVANDDFFDKLEKAINGEKGDETATGETVTKTAGKTDGKDVTPEGSKAEDKPAEGEGTEATAKKRGTGKLRKALEAQGATLERIASLFAEGNEAEGIPAGAVLKALNDLRADVDAAKTAAGAALDGVAEINGRPIKKSLDGQDGSEPVQKSEGENLDTLMRGLAANAVRGNGNRVTLR